jgi:hypothetical protein
MANYDGLTRNTWTGTWSPSGTHPIVLDTEIRGGLRFVSGEEGDRLEDISGQRLQEGMLVYLKNEYDEFQGDKYYKYLLLEGEERDLSTGEMPNDSLNWSEVSFGSGGGSGGGGSGSADLRAGNGIGLTNQGQSKIVSLTDTGVAAGTYGSAKTVPVLTIDQQGRVVSATEQIVSSGVARIDILKPEDIQLSGFSDVLPFSDYNIGTVVSYFAKDENGDIVSLDVSIGDSAISFEAKEDLSNFDITLTYVLSESVKSDSYKYNLSGNSYSLRHNGINNLINFYALDPNGNVVDLGVNVSDSDLTVESNYSLDGHSLYVITN